MRSLKQWVLSLQQKILHYTNMSHQMHKHCCIKPAPEGRHKRIGRSKNLLYMAFLLSGIYMQSVCVDIC